MTLYCKEKHSIQLAKDKSGKWKTPIPAILYSEATGRLFSHCSECGLELLQNGAGYIIVKSVIQNLTYGVLETFMEYALCFQCHQRLWNSLSSKTIRQLERYIEKSVDFVSRNRSLQQRKKCLHDWIGHCIVTGIPLDKCEGFQINALAIGNELVFDDLPYSLCFDAMREEEKCFSKSSWQTWSSYFDAHFGYPPLIRDILGTS